MRSQRIRTKPDRNMSSAFQIGGWLHGRHTYLWFGMDGKCIGTIYGQHLYRLAKAIVKHVESEPRK